MTNGLALLAHWSLGQELNLLVQFGLVMSLCALFKGTNFALCGVKKGRKERRKEKKASKEKRASHAASP